MPDGFTIRSQACKKVERSLQRSANAGWIHRSEAGMEKPLKTPCTGRRSQPGSLRADRQMAPERAKRPNLPLPTKTPCPATIKNPARSATRPSRGQRPATIERSVAEAARPEGPARRSAEDPQAVKPPHHMNKFRCKSSNSDPIARRTVRSGFRNGRRTTVPTKKYSARRRSTRQTTV